MQASITATSYVRTLGIYAVSRGPQRPCQALSKAGDVRGRKVANKRRKRPGFFCKPSLLEAIWGHRARPTLSVTSARWTHPPTALASPPNNTLAAPHTSHNGQRSSDQLGRVVDSGADGGPAAARAAAAAPATARSGDDDGAVERRQRDVLDRSTTVAPTCGAAAGSCSYPPRFNARSALRVWREAATANAPSATLNPKH